MNINKILSPKKTLILSVVASVFVLLALSTPVVFASSCAGIETNLIKCNDRGGGSVVNLLIDIVNFLAVGVGILVVGGIVWGGSIYASSNGDSSKVQQAKTIIVNAIVGLLLFIFMYALINYMVPGGLFN